MFPLLREKAREHGRPRSGSNWRLQAIAGQPGGFVPFTMRD
jgi:hypothetical protein